MKIITDNAEFRLVMREENKILEGGKIASVVHGTTHFPFQLFSDNCSLFLFLLEKEVLVREKSFITDVYLDGRLYCTIYHQHVNTDDGNYEKFIVKYTFRLSKVFVVDC